LLEPLPESRPPEPPSDVSRLELCLPERLPESLGSLSELAELRADRVPDLALDNPEPLSETPLSPVPAFLLAFLLACLPVSALDRTASPDAPALGELLALGADAVSGLELPPPSREPTAPAVERTGSLAASECVIELVSPLSADPAELTALPGLDGALLGAEAFEAERLDTGVLDGGLLDAAGLDGMLVGVCA